MVSHRDLLKSDMLGSLQDIKGWFTGDHFFWMWLHFLHAILRNYSHGVTVIVTVICICIDICNLILYITITQNGCGTHLCVTSHTKIHRSHTMWTVPLTFTQQIACNKKTQLHSEKIVPCERALRHSVLDMQC